MVDCGHSDGKKSDNALGFVPVVAGALGDRDGRWLMHCRPLEKHHGGLWEFPGGKVEPGEMPGNALVRELQEELGIEIALTDIVPVGFAEDESGSAESRIVILLYKVLAWVGQPNALEGGRIGWFRPTEIATLPKPPLDQELAGRLFAAE